MPNVGPTISSPYEGTTARPAPAGVATTTGYPAGDVPSYHVGKGMTVDRVGLSRGNDNRGAVAGAPAGPGYDNSGYNNTTNVNTGAQGKLLVMLLGSKFQGSSLVLLCIPCLH